MIKVVKVVVNEQGGMYRQDKLEKAEEEVER
jgi:hypothetical protein